MPNYFKPAEFVCKCGKCKEIPAALVPSVLKLAEQLNYIRTKIERPVKVNSGVRCEKHNANVGGKNNSEHLHGRAADIAVEGYNGSRLAGFIEALIAEGLIEDGGLGTYENFVHYDIGPSRRWAEFK